MPIVWTLPDTSVAVTVLEETYLARERLPRETTDEAVTRLAGVIKGKVPSLKDATLRLVKTADMPTDRLNRENWVINGSGKIDTTRLSR